METLITQRPENDYRDNLITTPVSAGGAVDWCAVFAGAVASAALSLILLFLGTGFGLTMVSPWSSEGISATSFGVSSIAGVTVISLLASALGGYLAGRLRTRWLNTPVDEVFFRDTAHGFLSWSVATLGTAALLTTVIGGIISGGAKAGAALGATAVAGTAAVAAAPDQTGDKNDMRKKDTLMPYLMDSLFRRYGNTNTSPISPSATNPANATNNPENGTPTDNTATNNTTNNTANNTAAFSNNREALRNLPKGEISRIYMNALITGSLPDNDLKYAGQLVAQATGIDQQTAENRVRDTFSTLKTKLEEAEKAAKEAADKARKISAGTSLWLFISLLIGAFIASLMAVYGGRQRDF